MSNEIVIRLRDRTVRKLERFQLLQDAASTVALVPAGLARIHSPDPVERAFAFVELGAVAVLAVATIMELRDDDDSVKGISWTNIIVGAVLLVENAIRVHEGHKWMSPTFLTAISSIVVGSIQGWLSKRKTDRRALRIDDNRLHIRLGKFRRFEYPWSEISSVDEDDGVIRVTARNGKSIGIKLKRYDNADEVRAALLASARERVPALDARKI